MVKYKNMKHLYEIPVKVLRGTNLTMPKNLIGAYVSCYVITDSDHLEAIKSVVKELRNDGYIFTDLMTYKIHEFDPYKWDEYINKTWPEHKDHFVNQENLLRAMVTDQVFYGPFCGWDRE